jgi:RNA-directed DNA polymerase
MPSQQSEKRHRAQLKQVVSHHTAATQSELIGQLNLVIRGWCQYFSIGVSKASFASQSAYLFRQLWRWAKRRHSNLNSHQITARYWLVHEGGGWTFQSKDGRTLLRHDQMPIRRHVKVQAHRSPYDGDWTYWGTRFRTYPELPTFKASLLKQQRGRCAHCGHYFLPEDRVELHHRDGDRLNSRRQNLALLHRHCHDQVHATATQPTTGIPDTEPSWREAG